jgi:hypothetical protein
MRNDPPSGLTCCGLRGCTKSAIRYGMCMLSLQICTRQYHLCRTENQSAQSGRGTDGGGAGLSNERYAPVLLRFFAIAGAEPDHFVGVNKIASVTIHAHFWSRSVRESKNGKWGWQNYRNSGKWGWQKCALLVCNIPVPYRIVVSRYEHSVTV